MSTHKSIDKICCVALVVALLVTALFMNAEKLGVQSVSNYTGYEGRLFDISTVHTIDIVMNDWESFIETCEKEEYALCSVVIDGEAFKNVGIRAKGNTSLSTVSQMDSDRYSFKLEFDQYDSTKTYYGLDKLSLNNIIQDNTYMKDFLVYQMMNRFGVDAPLCSYVYITVNGEDWGLYLAVEGVEDAFLNRNYGSDQGELYKPDSMSFGGGRGNGMEFDMENFDPSTMFGEQGEMPQIGSFPNEQGENPGGFDQNQIPSGQGGMPDGEMPGGFDPNQMFGGQGGMPDFGGGSGQGEMPDFGGDFDFSQMPGDRGGGMGSSDVKLQYIDDDPASYSNIFDNAKTDISDADQTRLIESLKTLSSGENIEDVVNIEEVIRYFVVHNFVVNGDSYTGSMVHNYYLYEEDGKLSMIPWDYNLAFGTFQSGNATSTVNDPIDSPVSGGSMDDRPMVAWIFENEEYTELYHAYFAEFIETFFDSGEFAQLVDNTAEMIASYVEKDPLKFCTYEEFETGVETIKQFCLLRAESVSGQLDGTIPTTTAGQSADSSTLIDASTINISDMGTMNMGGGFGGNREDFGNGERGDRQEGFGGEVPPTGESPQMPPGMIR